jgi:multicomponent Na+:H+ antiporter subunit D
MLLLIGSATVITGEIAAFKEKNLKKILAYSSMGQMGMIAIGIALASLGSVKGALLLVFSHSAAKLLLFLLSGFFIKSGYGADWESLKGIGRKYPTAGMLFVIGSMTLMGLPLFSSFWGKLELLKSSASFGGIGFIGFSTILMGSILEGVYLMKVSHSLFEKEEKDFKSTNRIGVYIPGVILALILIVIGIFPQLIDQYLNQCVKDLMGNEYIDTIIKIGGQI